MKHISVFTFVFCLFVLSSCIECTNSYDIDNMSNGEKFMYLSCYGNDKTWVHLSYNKEKVKTIDSLKIIISDLEGNSSVYKGKIHIEVDHFGMKEEDILPANIEGYEKFEDIPSFYRVPFYNINPVWFKAVIDNDSDKFYISIHTIGKDSLNKVRASENRFYIRKESNCGFHFLLH